MNFNIGVCIIVKGRLNPDHLPFHYRIPFHCAALDVTGVSLWEVDDIPPIVEDLRYAWEITDAPRPFVHFVETIPQAEHLIPLLCNELGSNYVVADACDDALFKHVLTHTKAAMENRRTAAKIIKKNV